jgi:hypothetical protein
LSAACHCNRSLLRRIICRPQVELEVWPARTELYFQDEAGVNPINKQVRIEAAIYNSRGGVGWEVRSIAGGAGAGTIDPSGLYRAPNKGGLVSGHTEIIVATANQDPLRKAFAWITLLGRGPAPISQPHVSIWPRRAQLYYPQGFQNDHMDQSNQMQLFQASVRDSAASAFDWLVDGVLQPGNNPSFLYQLAGSGSTKLVNVRARLHAQPSVFDDAKVVQLNYVWPGI